MSRRYQAGCLYRERRKAGPDIWVFRYREGQSNRKEQIGTVEQFPNRRTALQACELLRANINRETYSPRTVSELISHYESKELSQGSTKASSTRKMYGSYIKTWIIPAWGSRPIRDVKAVTCGSVA